MVLRTYVSFNVHVAGIWNSDKFKLNEKFLVYINAQKRKEAYRL